MRTTYKNQAQSAGELSLTPVMFKWPYAKREKKKKSQSLEKTVIPGQVEMEPSVIVKTFFLECMALFCGSALCCYLIFWRTGAILQVFECVMSC